MLPKKNRVSRAVFSTLLKKGVFFHSENLSFRVIKTVEKTQKGPSKFSFVVSKKVSKSATVRNLLRRRGYSSLRSSLNRDVKDSMNNAIVGAFFFKKGADKIDFSTLRDEIAFLLKKSGII